MFVTKVTVTLLTRLRTLLNAFCVCRFGLILLRHSNITIIDYVYI